MKRFALLPILAAVLIAAGCGGGDDGSGNAANAAATVASGEEAMKDSDAMKGEEAMKGDEAMKGGDAMEAEAAMKPSGTRLKLVSSEFGRVVADRKGEALYLFDRESKGKSECYGDCAEAWPPLLTKGKPKAGAGADATLLGTTKRRDGRLQVTYAGQPLYYYVGDSPGTILCHDVDEFGGTWLVVQADGEPAA